VTVCNGQNLDVSFSLASECFRVKIKRLAATENRRDLTPCFHPRNGLHLAEIEFPDSARDFFVPFLLGGGVDGLVKTFEQGTGQCSARFGRQGEGFF
jgi:hypothetical protein